MPISRRRNDAAFTASRRPAGGSGWRKTSLIYPPPERGALCELNGELDAALLGKSGSSRDMQQAMLRMRFYRRERRVFGTDDPEHTFGEPRLPIYATSPIRVTRRGALMQAIYGKTCAQIGGRWRFTS